MRQLTIRLEDDTDRVVRALARRDRISQSRVVAKLLRQGAGLSESTESATTIGSALDAFIGSWTESEERAILRTENEFEQVDEGLWK